MGVQSDVVVCEVPNGQRAGPQRLREDERLPSWEGDVTKPAFGPEIACYFDVIIIIVVVGITVCGIYVFICGGI